MAIPFDGEGSYKRVLFKITLDKDGVEDTHKDGNGRIWSNALNINDNLSIQPTVEKERQMMMAMPKLTFKKGGTKG